MTDSKGSEISISALSIFVAISIASVGFITTRTSISVGYNAATAGIATLLFAVAMFLVSMEFFLLAILNRQQLAYFGMVGSTLYGVGAIAMVVGVSLLLVVLNLSFLPYLFLAWVALLYVIYYAIRAWKIRTNGESPFRWIVRGVLAAEVAAGFYLITALGG